MSSALCQQGGELRPVEGWGGEVQGETACGEDPQGDFLSAPPPFTNASSSPPLSHLFVRRAPAAPACTEPQLKETEGVISSLESALSRQHQTTRLSTFPSRVFSFSVELS